MDNLSFSIFTIAFSTLCYFFSWRYWRKDNYRLAILLLILGGLLLRIYTSLDFFLHPWDERYHALVAKHLIQHPFTPTLYDIPILPYDYKSWTANHIWLHKPPLPLWIMSFSMWLFGINEVALRIPSIILSTIGIWLTFAIGRYFFNNQTGYLAAFFYSINGLIIELTGGRVATDHIDIFFLFFIELAIYFSTLYAQRVKSIYNAITGLCLGAAILSKWLPAMIVLPIWLLVVMDLNQVKSKYIISQFLLVIITCLATFLPWQFYIHNQFPLEATWEADFNFRHITESLDGHKEHYLFYFDKLITNYGELIFFAIAWFLFQTYKNLQNFKMLAICTWLFIPLIFFSLVNTKMQAYILFVSPAIFIIASEFWLMLMNFRINSKHKWILNLILVLLILLPIRYTIERTRLFKKTERNMEWVDELKNYNKMNIRNGIIFNYEKPIEAMFYTDLIAYPNIPDKNTIIELIQKGHTILIKNNEHVPLEIKSMQNVLMVK